MLLRTWLCLTNQTKHHMLYSMTTWLMSNCTCPFHREISITNTNPTCSRLMKEEGNVNALERVK